MRYNNLRQHQKSKLMRSTALKQCSTVFALNRWLIIMSYSRRPTVLHWVQLIHNMLDSIRMFTLVRSISLHMPNAESQVKKKRIETLKACAHVGLCAN